MILASSRSAGFTLLEVLLSVAIMGLLIGLSLPLYQSFQSRNDLDNTTQSVAEALRRAETYARGEKGDSTWGVEIVAGSAVVFKGASYATRTTTSDEPTVIASVITTSGLTDITFAKMTGLPSATGSISLTNTNTNDTRTVTLNAKGMVSY